MKTESVVSAGHRQPARHAARTRAGALLAILVLLPASAARAAAPHLPPVERATSLLVVAPHPDDETLCCAGLIQRVVAAGGKASIVWVTSGDASELDLVLIEHRLFAAPDKARELAQRRMREAQDAAALLGVPAARQFFLGYPDRGLLPILTAEAASAYRSGFTGATAVPYAQAVSPGHPYTRASLEGDLDAVLARVEPTLVVAPSPRDSHPDHRAAGLLSAAALARHAGLERLRYWIVHGGEGWPSPRGLAPGLPLTPAPRWRGITPAVFALTPAEEDRKLAALRLYHTQMQTLEPFLLAFVRSNELYAAEPPESAAGPAR